MRMVPRTQAEEAFQLLISDSGGASIPIAEIPHTLDIKLYYLQIPLVT